MNRPADPSEAPPTASTTRVAVVLGALIALTVIGSSAVAVAIPVVRADLDLSVSDAAWIFSLFSVAFSVATAVFGRVADLIGLRRPMVIGISMMAAGALIAALAPNLGVLLVGRLVQGFGSGAVPVLANGIIAARFSGDERGAVFGATFAVVSVVSGAGPVIGGTIDALLGWRFVFAVPMIAVGLIRLIVPLAPEGARGGRFDAVGAGLTAAAVAGVMMLLQAPTAGTAVGVAGGALVAAGAPLLVRHVRRRPGGFLPRDVVTDPVTIAAGVAGLTLLGGYFAGLLAVPVLLEQQQGWSSLQIGLALLPAAAAGGIGSQIAGRMLSRVGHFRLGAVVAAGSVTCLLLAAARPDVAPLLVLGVAGSSIGFSGGSVAMNDRVTLAAPEGTLGVTIGMVNMIQFVGGAFGTALLGGLSGLVPLHVALGCAAVLPMTGVVVLSIAARRDRRLGLLAVAEP